MAYHYRKKLEARKKKVRRIKIILAADGILMAELADAPDLGSGVHDVQVQVLLSAVGNGRER